MSRNRPPVSKTWAHHNGRVKRRRQGGKRRDKAWPTKNAGLLTLSVWTAVSEAASIRPMQPFRMARSIFKSTEHICTVQVRYCIQNLYDMQARKRSMHLHSRMRAMTVAPIRRRRTCDFAPLLKYTVLLSRPIQRVQVMHCPH